MLRLNVLEAYDSSRDLILREFFNDLLFVAPFCDIILKQASNSLLAVSVDFKASHCPRRVTLYAAFFYVRYPTCSDQSADQYE